MELEYAQVGFNIRVGQNPPIRDFIVKHLRGLVLDITAGYTELPYETLIANDIDEKCPTDYHFDAEDVLEYFSEDSFDTVVIMPPGGMVKEDYGWKEGDRGKYSRVRDAIAKVVKKGGRVIHTGYDSKGMGHRRGFKKIALLTVCYLGHPTPDDHILVEEKL